MGKRFSEKGKKLLLRRILPAGLILAACAGGAYAVSAARYNTRFLPGTVINGIDVSDMTLDEAENSIRTAEEDYELTIHFRDDAKETLSASDVKLRYDCAKEIQGILDEQNGYTWLSREFGDSIDYTLKTGVSCSDKALDKALSALPELQDGNYVRPQNACLDVDDSFHYTIVPETEGSEVVADVLTKSAKKAILAKKESLDLTEVKGAYREPTVRSDSDELLARQSALNALTSANITVKLSSGATRTVNSDLTKDWITTLPDGRWVVEESKVAENAAAFIADVAKTDDNYGYFRSFASTNYGMQKFDSDYLHGHTLDQAAMTSALTEMVLKGETAELDPVYSQYEDNKDPYLGGTYVEVDIYAQHVYYYEDYSLVYDCSCVTGTEGYTSTPSGIFSVDEKERGRTLNGYRSDGTLSYSVYVRYWISFYPHYGLHDASWRDSFGGSIYEYDGSHGCVNLPTSAAATLYDLVGYGTPVVIFRGRTSEG